jgi:hypothetical protein
MRVDIEKIRRKCEAAVRIAAAEFSKLPVYILFDSELPTRLHEGIGGMAWRDSDMCFRPFIQAWRGRGPCVVLSAEVWRDATTSRRVISDGVGVALHEFAHLLDDGEPEQKTWANEAGPATLPTPAEAVVLRHSPEDSSRLALYANLFAHDSNFVRVLCHMRYRCALRRIATGTLALGLHDAIAPCMSNLFDYDMSLIGELRGTSPATPYAEILKRPAPVEFRRRWNRNLDAVVSKVGGEMLANELRL